MGEFTAIDHVEVIAGSPIMLGGRVAEYRKA